MDSSGDHTSDELGIGPISAAEVCAAVVPGDPFTCALDATSVARRWHIDPHPWGIDSHAQVAQAAVNAPRTVAPLLMFLGDISCVTPGFASV